MSEKMELSLGDIVETVKGASFWGKIIGLHAIGAVNPGAVVEAIDPGFAGTRHVYQLAQLRRRPAQTPEGWQLVPSEPTPLVLRTTGHGGNMRHE